MPPRFPFDVSPAPRSPNRHARLVPIEPQRVNRRHVRSAAPRLAREHRFASATVELRQAMPAVMRPYLPCMSIQALGVPILRTWCGRARSYLPLSTSGVIK
jgi:hypothetical protein